MIYDCFNNVSEVFLFIFSSVISSDFFSTHKVQLFRSYDDILILVNVLAVKICIIIISKKSANLYYVLLYTRGDQKVRGLAR